MICNGLSVEQAFVGSCQVGQAAWYSYEFVKYLYPKKLEVQSALQLEESDRDRIVNRICSSVNVVGAMARLGDWIVEQKWVVIGAVQTIALKMMAHITGIFYYLKESLSVIDTLNELDELTSSEERMTTYSLAVKDSLEVYKYAEWTRLFSNIIFVVTSVAEVAFLITGVVFLSPAILNIMLVTGFACWIGAWILRKNSGIAEEKLDFARACLNERYSFYG